MYDDYVITPSTQEIIIFRELTKVKPIGLTDGSPFEVALKGTEDIWHCYTYSKGFYVVTEAYMMSKLKLAEEVLNSVVMSGLEFNPNQTWFTYRSNGISLCPIRVEFDGEVFQALGSIRILPDEEDLWRETMRGIRDG